MPTQDIDLHASKVNKLKIVTINGERKMYKDDKVVRAIPFDSAIAQFKSSLTVHKHSQEQHQQTGTHGSHWTQCLHVRHSNSFKKSWK